MGRIQRLKMLLKMLRFMSDDENANVGKMGYANVDEGAYAMPPPPPPVHPMQPQWEPPARYFDSYFANI
jgi:hypothetical protein